VQENSVPENAAKAAARDLQQQPPRVKRQDQRKQWQKQRQQRKVQSGSEVSLCMSNKGLKKL
jgi:hypothetical protein